MSVTLKNQDVRIRVRWAIRKIWDVRIRVRLRIRDLKSGHGHEHVISKMSVFVSVDGYVISKADTDTNT